MKPTPTPTDLPLRPAEFENLAEALDYAAGGDTGFNFYGKDGRLKAVLSYRNLRDEAKTLARRMLSINIKRGARVALVAETHHDFLRFFFACQYAGFVPVPLPISAHLGGHKAFAARLHRLLIDCRAELAAAPEEYLIYLEQAALGPELVFWGSPSDYAKLPKAKTRLRSSTSGELAYLQYTSGSTRFPVGVMISQATVMTNLALMTRNGIRVRSGDKGMSWLPFYNDMGLVGFVLAAVTSQMSVDYLSPADFVMRPRLWLTLMSRNKATISFSPPLGYELVLKRIKREHIESFDLSTWRVAGVGAEPVRIQPLFRFAKILKPTGFNPGAFLVGYGLAETTLAVSFSPLGQGLGLDVSHRDFLTEFQVALRVGDEVKADTTRAKAFVNCGEPLPGYEIQIRDNRGRELPDRCVGTLFVRGSSVMQGYFNDIEATREVLSPNGWFNTGDLAYRAGRRLYITGRKKDMIIINGRNIWPQDIEYVAKIQPEVETGNASAFSVPGPESHDWAVLVVQIREKVQRRRAELAGRLLKRVREELGVDCLVEFVPRHSLPRTTSGKLSRSTARKNYLKRNTAAQRSPIEKKHTPEKWQLHPAG